MAGEAKPEAWKAARSQKLAENQAHRAAKRNRAKTVVVAEARVLTWGERQVSTAVVEELDKSLGIKGEAHADGLARNTRYWMDFAWKHHPLLGLESFAAAEAQRWHDARHPRPVQAGGGNRFEGGRR